MNFATITSFGLLLSCLLVPAEPAAISRTDDADRSTPSASRTVTQTDETIAVALAGEIDLNPMLVGFVKADYFGSLIALPPDTRMPQTIFAPALEYLQSETYQRVLDGEEVQPLQDFLRCHVAYGRVLDEHFHEGGSVMIWMQDDGRHRRVAIDVDEDGRLTAGGIPVLRTIETANGVIHVIDGMLG